jgi:hypothetical protein
LSAHADGDGILYFVDRGGSESQMEQVSDKDSERKQENIRSFMSCMSMLGNWDLTRMSDEFTDNRDNSLTSVAIAGIAQIARMHSARLQQPLSNVPIKKQDLKKAIEMFNSQTKEAKPISLITLAKIMDKIPTAVSEDFPTAVPPNV